MTHSLSTGICILRPPGQENQGKQALVVVIVTGCFLWLLHGDMLPFYGSHSVGDIPCVSKLLHTFPFIRAIRAVQIFVLEFRKDGSADLEDKFADGGVVNLHVITARRCGSLLWPGVSALLPVSVQLVMAS